jgi:hypothetical protein
MPSSHMFRHVRSLFDLSMTATAAYHSARFVIASCALVAAAQDHAAALDEYD